MTLHEVAILYSILVHRLQFFSRFSQIDCKLFHLFLPSFQGVFAMKLTEFLTAFLQLGERGCDFSVTFRNLVATRFSLRFSLRPFSDNL
jgi:hypothetical protein